MNKILIVASVLLFSLFSMKTQAKTTWIPIGVGDISIIIPYTPSGLLMAPTNINFSIENGVSTLSWNDVEHASQFEVQGLNEQGQWVTIVITESLSIVLTGNNTAYHSFRVVACSYSSCVNTGVWSVPPEPIDDNSIGSIDNDGNGIRDDVELRISRISSINSLKNGYLQHTAFYTRAFLLATTNVNKKRFFIEMMKGHACLITSSNGEEAYAQVVAGHLDSKERFERYTLNNSSLNQESITVNNMDCVLKGIGVEPISKCIEDSFVYGPSNIHAGNSLSKFIGKNMGENVKLTITIANETITSPNSEPGGSFVASIHFGKPHEDLEPALASETVEENTEFSYIIDNYNFDTNGFVYGKVDDYVRDSAVRMTFTCEANQ